MSGMGRRVVLKGGLMGLAAIGLPAGLAAAAPAAPRLFLYDSRFAPARAEALSWEARGSALLDVQAGDLGLAWRQRIAPLLARGEGLVAGRTLGSHRLICAIFAREQGLALLEDVADCACETRGWKLA